MSNQSSDDIRVCPYNKSHLVLKSRFQNHLVKCAKANPHLYVCVYNATHRMPIADMLSHLQICESKKNLVLLANKKTNLRPIYHDKEDAIVSEEIWDY